MDQCERNLMVVEFLREKGFTGQDILHCLTGEALNKGGICYWITSEGLRRRVLTETTPKLVLVF